MPLNWSCENSSCRISNSYCNERQQRKGRRNFSSMTCWVLLFASWLTLAHASERTVSGRSVSFSGNGAFALDIPRFPHASQSLEEFLSDEGSSGLLVGSDDLTALPDGQHWDCRQPSLTFFGLVMTPVFRIGLWRRRFKDGIMKISVQVKESRTEIRSQRQQLHQQTPTDGDGHWLSSLFSQSSIQGKSDILVQPTAHGWVLSLESELYMKLKVPKYLPLPPGFAKIGSAIMKLQCQDRARQSLEQLRDAYLAWATSQQSAEHQTVELVR